MTTAAKIHSVTMFVSFGGSFGRSTYIDALKAGKVRIHWGDRIDPRPRLPFFCGISVIHEKRHLDTGDKLRTGGSRDNLKLVLT